MRKALRLALAALALFSIAVGAADLANGIELVREVDGRMRPSIGIINVAVGLLLLGFTVPRAWWREPNA